MSRSVFALATVALLGSGCVFYVGGGADDDDVVVVDGGMGTTDAACLPTVPPPPPQRVRDPYSGECHEYNWGGGCNGGPPPVIQYACESYCNALDETDCLAADGCRAVYVDACPLGADCGPANRVQFGACWGVTPGGPVQGGDCTAITDAWECGYHDDCAPLHEYRVCQPGDPCETPVGAFRQCLKEPGTMPPPPVPACAGLDEPRCIDMVDGCFDWNGQPVCGDHKCEPIYVGSGCSCNPMTGVCDCQTQSYVSCRTAP
jgi:hypothetical protein